MLLSGEEFAYVIFSLVFPVLYTRGPSWIQFYTKFLLYYASLTFSASLVLPFTLFRPKDPRNLLWTQSLMKQTASLLGLRYSITNEIQAKKRLSFDAEKGSTAVVVVNHQSSLDVLGLLCHLWPLMDGQCTVIAKKSLLFAGPFGLMAYMSGITFIDRNKQSEAKEIMKKTVEKCKEQNWKLVVFPEGTRCHRPKELDMRPFKLGAFSSALSSQVPIQPVVFSHYDWYDSSTSFKLNPGGIRIHVLEPIECQNQTDSNSFAEYTREKMLCTLREDAKLHPFDDDSD